MTLTNISKLGFFIIFTISYYFLDTSFEIIKVVNMTKILAELHENIDNIVTTENTKNSYKNNRTQWIRLYNYIGTPPPEIIKRSAEIVSKWSNHSIILPYEEEDYYEGDIFYAPSQITPYTANIKSRLWPNNEVMYSFDHSVVDNLRQLIIESMAEIQTASLQCIKFREFVPISDINSLRFTSLNTGCYSSEIGYDNSKFYYVSSRKNPPYINIQYPACAFKSTIIHEILHSLGFFHEHNRPDRDKYVKIMWNNIIEGRERNFRLVGKDEINTLDTPYDYYSIMHYGSFAFSKNKFKDPTILRRDTNGIIVRVNQNMSPLDVYRLKSLYRCPVHEHAATNE